jgi:hypothetical protein
MIGGCVRRLVVRPRARRAARRGLAVPRPAASAWHDIRGIRESELVATPELADRRSASSRRWPRRVEPPGRRAVRRRAAEPALYRYQGVLPGFLGTPAIEMRDDRLRLRARVPVDKLPNVEGLGEAAAFLPDTTELTVSGAAAAAGYRAASRIRRRGRQRAAVPAAAPARAGRARALGRRDEPGLPPTRWRCRCRPASRRRTSGATRSCCSHGRAPATPRTERPTGPMARILVVDDEEGIRKILRQVLEYEGHDVRVAAAAARRSSSTAKRGRTSSSWT